MQQKEIVFRRPVDGALYLFRKGYKVFPLVPNEKTPAVKDWQEWAKGATEKKISDYGTANPLANWGVSCGPSGLVVVDIDNKGKRQGDASYKTLCQAHGATATFEVLTPTGGRHLYFTGEGRNTASHLGDGIDTRGEGGYVVAPGSRLGDDIYRITDPQDAAPLPAFLSDKLGERKAPVRISEDAPIIEGERNNTLTRLAGVMRRAGLGFEAINAALQEENHRLVPPLPAYEIENIAGSISRYAPEDVAPAIAFLKVEPKKTRRANEIHPTEIRKRDWVMADRYLGGYVSVIVAPGGVGKSMLTMLDAIAICSGKPITGFEIKKPGPVWLYNTEDPMEELERRIVAASVRHKIPLSDLGGLHISSGRDNPLVLAKMHNNNLIVNTEEMRSIISHIKEQGIVLLVIDPFVHSHECNENDNMQIAKVAWCFQQIATATGCAIAVIHHASKAGAKAEEGDVNISRGASALTNAARIAHTVQNMTRNDAHKFGIPADQHRWYLRIDDAKANMQPPAERAQWYKKVSVFLFDDESVGCLEKINLVDVKTQIQTHEMEAERRDLANVLSSLLNIGDKKGLLEIEKELFQGAKYKHLFSKEYKSPKSKRTFLDAVFASGPVAFGEKLFLKCEKDDRTKHAISCVMNVNPPNNIFD